MGGKATAGTGDTLVAFVAAVWAGLALGAKVASGARLAGGAGKVGRADALAGGGTYTCART